MLVPNEGLPFQRYSFPRHLPAASEAEWTKEKPALILKDLSMLRGVFGLS